jgi:hypothetical protein
MKDSIFNYYDITDGWTDYKSNLNAEDCQKSCRYSLSCLFSIHFYENQNPNNRKPINGGAKNNTCILRNKLNIQYGTQKDRSANIYYLTGILIISIYLILRLNIIFS